MSKRTWPRACFCRRYREAHSEAAPSCCQRASRRRQCLLDTGHLRPHLHRCWLGAAPGSGQPWPPQATTQNCWGLPLRAAPSSGSAWPGPTDPISGHHVLPRPHSPRCSPWQVLQAGGDPAATWLIPHHTRGQRCQTRAGCSQTSHLCSRAKGWDKRVPDLVVDAAACRPSSFPTPSSQHSRMEEKHEEPKTHATMESAFITGPLNLLVYFLFTTSGTEAHDCSQRGSCVSHTFTDFSDQELLIYPFLCTHFFEYLYQALQHWSHSHRNQHNLQCLTAARPQP